MSATAPASSKPLANPTWKKVEPFLVGGASGMFATVCIQPIDMVKVRIQLSGEGGAKGGGALTILKDCIKNEGIMGLYTGLSAGLLRQATYTTARLGLFRTFTEKFDCSSLSAKAVAGLVAGGLGSIVGTPADLALIRMQADGLLPKEQRRNYTGVFNALSRIIKEEGFAGIFKGATPVVVRAMSLNAGMLASHDQVFQECKQRNYSNAMSHLAAKTVAGFMASAFSLPFDFVKTRIQKQKPDANGVLPYKNGIDCAKQTLAKEGPFAFYKGFLTYYIRIAPHTMITLLAVDAITDFLKQYK